MSETNPNLRKPQNDSGTYTQQMRALKDSEVKRIIKGINNEKQLKRLFKRLKDIEELTGYRFTGKEVAAIRREIKNKPSFVNALKVPKTNPAGVNLVQPEKPESQEKAVAKKAPLSQQDIFTAITELINSGCGLSAIDERITEIEGRAGKPFTQAQIDAIKADCSKHTRER